MQFDENKENVPPLQDTQLLPAKQTRPKVNLLCCGKGSGENDSPALLRSPPLYEEPPLPPRQVMLSIQSLCVLAENIDKDPNSVLHALKISGVRWYKSKKWRISRARAALYDLSVDVFAFVRFFKLVDAKMADNRVFDSSTAAALNMLCPIQGIGVVDRSSNYSAGLTELTQQLNEIRVTIPY